MKKIVSERNKKMKKVLIVTTVSGFVPQFEMHNVRILQEMGYEVHYASNFNNVSYGTDNRRLEGTGIVKHQVDFARSPFQWKENKKAFEQLKQLLKQDFFKLIHCHTPVASVLTRIVARTYRKRGTKVIYTAHGFHFYQGAPLQYWLLFYPLERFLTRYTDLLITINEEDFKRAKKFCKSKRTKVEHICGVGIDVEYWSQQHLTFKEKSELRKKTREDLGINENEFLLLSVGELNKNKNHLEVIKALESCTSDIKYIICGEGKMRKMLEAEINQFGLEQSVFLLGYCDDIRNLLNAADVFILPSLREGFSCALQEAMAASLPVIGSKIRGNKELIDEPRGGRCINPHNVQQIKRAIYEIKNEDRVKLGTYNFEKIKNYDKRDIGEKMKCLYQEILEGNER